MLTGLWALAAHVASGSTGWIVYGMISELYYKYLYLIASVHSFFLTAAALLSSATREAVADSAIIDAT